MSARCFVPAMGHPLTVLRTVLLIGAGGIFGLIRADLLTPTDSRL